MPGQHVPPLTVLDAAYAVLEADDRLAGGGARADQRRQRLRQTHAVVHAWAIGRINSDEAARHLRRIIVVS